MLVMCDKDILDIREGFGIWLLGWMVLKQWRGVYERDHCTASRSYAAPVA